MQKIIHKLYIWGFILILLTVFTLLLVQGVSYYSTPPNERFYHLNHETLKSSGLVGHGLGIIGSTILVVGVFGYMARKRIRLFSRIGYLKYWLEFHIFLCTLGPVLILFHTAFKFGGVVAISFWSMVAVIISGIIGRFIYIQIPRTIEGREMSLNEINNLKSDLSLSLKTQFNVDIEILKLMDKSAGINVNSEDARFKIFTRLHADRSAMKKVKKDLKTQNLTKRNYRQVIELIKSEIVLNRRIEWLLSMQNLLRYWHIAHLPFALIMLVIMIIHIVIAITFGYKWVF